MSKARGPGKMQRSRSYSHIPLPSNRDSRSRLPLRDSSQKTRVKSLSRQTVFCDSDMPSTSRQYSGSFGRLNTLTPSSQIGSRSSRKSPFTTSSSVRKDNRPVADKKWQQDQLIKVRRFFQERPEMNIFPANIKSGLSLETFMEVTRALLKEIDPRINFTKENYIEEVPTHLKLLHYPGSVKPSLMKVANTPHNWPQIVAIFSWLIDNICLLQKYTDMWHVPEDVTLTKDDVFKVTHKCMLESYVLWNSDKDETPAELALENALTVIYGADQSKLDELRAKNENLKQKKQEFAEKENNIVSEIERYKSSINLINETCAKYDIEQENFEHNMKTQIANLAEQNEKLDLQLVEASRDVEQLKQTIANQPYSVNQKQELETEINDLKHTLKLKKQRFEKQKELISSSDFELTAAKQKVETAVYRFNDRIKVLSLINPELKTLLIRESGFARPDMLDEVIEIKRRKRLLDVKVQKELEEEEQRVSQLEKEIAEIDSQNNSAKRRIEKLTVEENEMKCELAKLKQSREKELEDLRDEITSLKVSIEEVQQSTGDLQPLEKELEQVTKECETLEQTLKDSKEKGLQFFAELHTQILNNYEQYLNIMDSISDRVQLWQTRTNENMATLINDIETARAEVTAVVEAEQAKL